MLQLQSRLGDYFELIRPGRDLIKEGELQKVSRKGVGPRYFILLSDCLLYTSYSGSWSGSDTTSLRVSYQIPLSTLSVRLPHANANFRESFLIANFYFRFDRNRRGKKNAKKKDIIIEEECC